MAEKKGKKKQSATYCKEADTDFHKGADNAFTGGNAAYQPRDANAAKTAQTEGRKKQTEKSMHTQQETFGQKVQKSEEQQSKGNDTFTENKGTNAQSQDAKQRVANRTSKARTKKQMYQSTSGQKVQKFGEKPKQEEKTDFVKENSAFNGQDQSSQPEEAEKRQPDTDDYHRRDTYRQSQKKGKYHKKRVRKEYRGGENTKENTFAEDVFTENTGNSFQEESGSDFTGSKKLQRKQKQAEKAGKKVQKASEAAKDKGIYLAESF